MPNSPIQPPSIPKPYRINGLASSGARFEEHTDTKEHAQKIFRIHCSYDNTIFCALSGPDVSGTFHIL